MGGEKIGDCQPSKKTESKVYRKWEVERLVVYEAANHYQSNLSVRTTDPCTHHSCAQQMATTIKKF